MAPYTPYKKHVKFAKSRSPIPRKKTPNTAESYANIVLHYLSKLKGLFKSARERNNDSSSYFDGEKYDPISKSILKKGIRRSGYSDSDSENKQKVYDIVNAALQYGCANDIIEKVGNYFLVKAKSPPQKVATRRPTPGPDYFRCASCKNLSKFATRRKSVVDLRGKDKISSKFRRHSTYYDDDYGRTTPTRRKRSASNTSVVNYCPKCYSRMKSNRRL